VVHGTLVTAETPRPPPPMGRTNTYCPVPLFQQTQELPRNSQELPRTPKNFQDAPKTLAKSFFFHVTHARTQARGSISKLFFEISFNINNAFGHSFKVTTASAAIWYPRYCNTTTSLSFLYMLISTIVWIILLLRLLKTLLEGLLFTKISIQIFLPNNALVPLQVTTAEILAAKFTAPSTPATRRAHDPCPSAGTRVN